MNLIMGTKFYVVKVFDTRVHKLSNLLNGWSFEFLICFNLNFACGLVDIFIYTNNMTLFYIHIIEIQKLYF